MSLHFALGLKTLAHSLLLSPDSLVSRSCDSRGPQFLAPDYQIDDLLAIHSKKSLRMPSLLRKIHYCE